MNSNTFDLSHYLKFVRPILQVLIFTWFGVLLLALFFYSVTASSPLLGDITWVNVASFATNWWLSAFGAKITVDTLSIALTPTLLSFLIAYFEYKFLRKIGIQNWAEVLASSVLNLFPVVMIGFLSTPLRDWWFAIFGALLLGALVAILVGRENLLANYFWWEYVVGASTHFRFLFRVYLGVTVLLFLLAISVSWSHISAISGLYYQGFWGNLGLFMMQVLYLPTFILWFFAWFIGAGFSLSTTTFASIMEVRAGLLPAIPVFGMLPENNYSVPWLIIVPIVTSLVIGVVMTRRFQDIYPQRNRALLNALIASLLFTTTIFFFGTFSSGGLGNNSLSYMGVQPPFLILFLLGVVVVPILLATAGAHAQTIASLRSLLPKRMQTSTEPHGIAESLVSATEDVEAECVDPKVADDSVRQTVDFTEPILETLEDEEELASESESVNSDK